MLRSLYSAVSAIKAHQTYLDVTGNNIANVNTVGFKKDVIHFRDMIYQDSKNASAPDNSIPIGGINPAQVGLGVQVGSIETIHTGGSLQSTGIPTDMAISGAGFFVVDSGTQRLYTRAGNFSLDANGNMVMQGNGYRVMGYEYLEQVDQSTGTITRVLDSSLSNININIGEKFPAKASTLVAFRCNLESNSGCEITNLKNPPIGADKALRPYDYEAAGAVKVTYVAPTATPPPVADVKKNDTWYDTTTSQVKTWDGTAWIAASGETGAYYYGSSGVAGSTTSMLNQYKQHNGTATGVMAKLESVDYAYPTATPPSAGVLSGQTWLDTLTGEIWKATAPAPTYPGDWVKVGDMQKNTVYGAGVAAEEMYALADDGTTIINDTTGSSNLGPAGNRIMSSDDHLLYIWNQLDKKWEYSSYGNEAQIPARDVSNTTKANFESYADNIMKANDRATKIDVYDSLGNAYTLETVFRKVVDVPADPTASPPTGAEAEWDWYSFYVDSSGVPIPEYGVGAGTLVFGDDGLLKRTYYYDPDEIKELLAGNLSTIEYIEVTIDAEGVPKDENGNAITGKVGADFNTVGAQGQVVTNGTTQTYVPNFISLDFLGYSIGRQLDIEKEPIDGVTQYGARTSTTGYYQDGYAMGLLQNWSVSQTGVITGSYSNGKTLPIAQVALAMFANDQGLLKVGETCFAETANSGLAQIGTPMEGGSGSVVGNTVEMSNVDLSEEFVNLIRAQRGFQANSRVVTTSDQVLEELINLKR